MTSKRGTSLVEMACVLVAASGLLCVGGALLGLTAGRALLFADAHSLARAHLYGNARHHCAPTSHWPPLRELRIEHRCSGTGLVESRLLWEGVEKLAVRVRLDGQP